MERDRDWRREEHRTDPSGPGGPSGATPSNHRTKLGHTMPRSETRNIAALRDGGIDMHIKTGWAASWDVCTTRWESTKQHANSTPTDVPAPRTRTDNESRTGLSDGGTGMAWKVGKDAAWPRDAHQGSDDGVNTAYAPPAAPPAR